jgi:O-methyltransferase involved in polyketide biosynthesis
MAGHVPAGLDVSTPNVARIYDYFLGGKDNFAADRQAAEELVAMMPQLPAVARANRAFVRRAVRFAAGHGIRQFIDVGAGLPTRGNVHEVARQAAPDARVLYVDNDPVVCSHGRALLAGEATGVVQADLRRPEEVIGDPLARALIDFAEPVALLLTAVLHFVPDEDDPRRVIARFGEVMAPGSCLVISHGTVETGPDDPRAQLSAAVYSRASAPLALRPLGEVRRLFDGFELVEPGLVWISRWRPEPAGYVSGAAETLRGGVGRKPS